MMNKIFKLTVLFIFTMTLSCCNSEKEVIGKWEVIDFTTDAKNVPDIVFKNGKEFALSIIYEIRKDGSYSSSSSDAQNYDEIPIKMEYEGIWKYNNSTITFTPKKIKIQQGNKWKTLNDYDDPPMFGETSFKESIYKVNIESKNQIIFIDHSKIGNCYLTLQKIE